MFEFSERRFSSNWAITKSRYIISISEFTGLAVCIIAFQQYEKMSTIFYFSCFERLLECATALYWTLSVHTIHNIRLINYSLGIIPPLAVSIFFYITLNLLNKNSLRVLVIVFTVY